MNTIEIHRGSTGWLATYHGPHANEIIELFGTTTLPLPWTLRAPVGVVLNDLRARTPDATITARAYSVVME